MLSALIHRFLVKKNGDLFATRGMSEENMQNAPVKLSLLIGLTLVFVPGVLLSTNLDQLPQNYFLNFAIGFTLIIYAALVLETLRKISLNEKVDFTQNKVDILHSSFLLLDGNSPLVSDENDSLDESENLGQSEFNPALMKRDTSSFEFHGH